MTEKELRPNGGTLDSYNPSKAEEYRLWRDGGIIVPEQADIEPDQFVRFETFLHTGKQIVALATLVHRDFPGVTVQWQLIVPGMDKAITVQRNNTQTKVEFLPEALLAQLYEELVGPMLYEMLFDYDPARLGQADLIQ